MAGRLEGERVFCHQCNNEWDRAHGGLTCPRCEGDFTEILEPGTTSSIDAARGPSPSPSASPRHSPLQPLYDHNPWGNDDSDPDVPLPDPFQHRPPQGFTTFEYTNHGGGARISFTRTIRTSGFGSNSGAMPPIPGLWPQQPGPFRDFESNPFPGLPNAQPQAGNLQEFVTVALPGAVILTPNSLFSMILQSMHQPQQFHQQFYQQRGGDAGHPEMPTNPFDLLSALLNPAQGRHGDMVFSQEAFDRVMSQLMEQNNGSTAPPPASEEAIRSLKKRRVDKDLLGAEGQAECSICMEEVKLDSEITELPCKHWFHGECVTAWLKEHDTCPHCRKSISTPDQSQNPQASSSQQRPSRRPSEASGPWQSPPDGSRYNPIPVPESPSDVRDARRRYYGDSSTEAPIEPLETSQYSSSGDHHQRPRRGDSGSSGGSRNANSGGVGGWIRDHLPFS